MDERPDQVRRQGVPEEGVRERLSRERDEIDPNPRRADDELESLRLELAQTRSQMSETVYALQGRLNPQYVREQASSQARDTAREAGSSVVDTIKNNPVPAALAGAGLVGLGWLVASGSSSGSGGSSGRRSLDDGPYYYGSSERSYPTYYEEGEYGGSSEGSGRQRAREATGQAQTRAQEAAGQARERVGQVGGQLQNRAGEAGEQAQQQARRARSGFQRMLQESPLALGALALGVGAAVGFAAPRTGKEDEVMGEARDSLVERGKQSARETRERAQRVLEEGRRSAEQEAQRQDLTSE